MEAIKNATLRFPSSGSGLSSMTVLFFLVAVAVLFFLIRKLLPKIFPHTHQKIKRSVDIILLVVFYTVITVLVLQALILEQYDKLIIYAFAALLAPVTKAVSWAYKKYDQFVDRNT